ncbi:hypothetical protein LG047_02540 [Methylocystis sp. WRRC1]|uniref:hypothetical protein n=1 Tax=Methylocystis sp. WRRC1 TaxID=1732014 RepID=UPI001D140126|nr:hypothetical protein [Methylocystis sp. WRRC1]MCC3244210.1 hypothetical protein [Methylocystis sp. WRRC1]
MSEPLYSLTIDDAGVSVKAIAETREEATRDIARLCRIFGVTNARTEIRQTYPLSWVAEATKEGAGNVAIQKEGS